MDFLETKEEEEDSQGVDKTAMVLDEQTDILDEQVGLGGAEIITGAGGLKYVHTELAGCNWSQSEITI